jgi:acetoin utilization deacetylase AcuC-like enzyme
VHIPSRIDDDGYLGLAKDALKKWVRAFTPEIIFWNWGYDGTVRAYGDIGLTPELHACWPWRSKKWPRRFAVADVSLFCVVEVEEI